MIGFTFVKHLIILIALYLIDLAVSRVCSVHASTVDVC